MQSDEQARQEVERELTQQALEVFKAQSELENNEAFKQFMLQKKAVDDMVSDFKKNLKQAMVDNQITSLTSPNGKDDWRITCSIAHKIEPDSEVNINHMGEEYVDEKELDMNTIVVKEGKVFEKVANTELVKNMRSLNLPLPKGFVDKEVARISIRVNGKAI